MFLSVKDLGERWSMDLRSVRRTVRECGLEMFQFNRDERGRVDWRRARFDLESVEAFEESRKRRYGDAPPPPPGPAARGRRRLAPRPDGAEI